MRRAALVLSVCLLCSACAESTLYVYDDSIAQLARLGLVVPAPPATWHAVPGVNAAVRIKATVQWGEPADAPDRDSNLACVIDDRYFAISADWLDAQPVEQDAQKAEPLETISLPRVVVPYHGLYPAQPGYALHRRVVIEGIIYGGRNTDRASDRRTAAAVSSYISSLPHATAPRGLVWIGAVGDMKPGGQTAALLAKSDGPDLVFRRMLPIMRAQDVLAGNLETAVTSRGTEWPKTYRFRMPASVLGPLIASGVDVVEIANNHVYDFSAVGFSDTVAALKAAGLPFVGAGMDRDEAVRPYSMAPGGEHVSLWAMAAFPVERTGFSGLRDASIQRGVPGLLWADDQAMQHMAESIRQSRIATSGREIDLVSVHAGTEYAANPSAAQIALYHQLIDMGADVVLGHHPHVLQPLEWYHGTHHSGLIAYSLGNFVFGGMDGIPAARETVLLSLGVLDGKVRAIRLFGGHLSGGTVDVQPDGSVERHLYAVSRAWSGRPAEKSP